MEKTVIFRNYCKREIWKPRLVNSRKYGGIKVPTFFVDQQAVWEKEPEHSLIIEIGNVTSEEYEAIKAANLHLQEGEFEAKETRYGRIIEDEQYKGKVFVGGLYICTEPRLDIGIDFKPKVVRLERDRSMVNSFDIQWYASRMIEELKDADLTKRSLNSYSGTYINQYAIPEELKSEVAEDFINQYGAKAVPVANQSDMEGMKKRGYKPVIVSEAKKEVILNSEFYADVKQELDKEREKARPIYERFCEFAEKIEDRLTEEETLKLYEFVDELKEEAQ
ncbi:MAG: hypothetical protein PHV18_04430 [Lachnospiraceae bacterium]|nr:hypothetical protein [Lachnospiraceae bacterium]